MDLAKNLYSTYILIIIVATVMITCHVDALDGMLCISIKGTLHQHMGGSWTTVAKEWEGSQL